MHLTTTIIELDLLDVLTKMDLLRKMITIKRLKNINLKSCIEGLSHLEMSLP